MTYLCLGVAAVISYIMRVIPFFSGKLSRLQEGSFLTRGLDYSVCFIIGEIIYSVAYRNQKIDQLIAQFNLSDIFTIIAIVFSFAVCVKTDSIMKSLAASLVLYVILLGAWL
ncbi:MAG: AzlD domain-containing protein [Francisellaceae bacterium]